VASRVRERASSADLAHRPFRHHCVRSRYSPCCTATTPASCATSASPVTGSSRSAASSRSSRTANGDAAVRQPPVPSARRHPRYRYLEDLAVMSGAGGCLFRRRGETDAAVRGTSARGQRTLATWSRRCRLVRSGGSGGIQGPQCGTAHHGSGARDRVGRYAGPSATRRVVQRRHTATGRAMRGWPPSSASTSGRVECHRARREAVWDFGVGQQAHLPYRRGRGRATMSCPDGGIPRRWLRAGARP
jgi:hypothetical protein